VRLIRKQEGLQIVRKQRKKRNVGTGSHRELQAEHPNHVWSYDFVEDATADGKRLRFLNIVDEFTRESLAISCSRSQNWGKVQRVLQELFATHGLPKFIRSDNGSELTARKLQEWLAEMKVQTAYIEPGSPWQNPFVESFNSIFRDECLNRWLFFTPREAQQIADAWKDEYNFERPHGSLAGKTPAVFAQGYVMSNAQEVA
jgi:transposase InsO family protein